GPTSTAHYTSAGEMLYCTWTIAGEPASTGRIDCALLRAAALVTCTVASPGALAMKVRVTRLPLPVMPFTPGGREVLIVTSPLPSSRCTVAVVWPSFAS